MDFLLDLGNWQYLVVGLIVVLSLYASAKNKAIYAKLVVLFGLTAVVLLQLAKTPQPKETALDSRIRLERQLLSSYSARPSVPAELGKVMDSLNKLNVSRDRNDAAKVEPLLKQLEQIKFPAEYMKDQANSLVQAWRTRIDSTPAALKAELATLEAKAGKTEQDRLRIASLKSMIPAWYDRLPLKFGLDLRGGTEVRLRLLPERERIDNFERQLAELKKDSKADPKEVEKLEKTIEQERERLTDNFRNASDVIRSRLNSSGLEEISVSSQGSDRLLIQMPGMSSAKAQGIINRLKRLGQLEFRLTVPTEGPGADAQLVAEVSKVGGKTDQKNYSRQEGRFLGEDEVIIKDGMKTDSHGDVLYDWMHDDEGRGFVLYQEVPLTGEFLSGARARPSQSNPGSFEIGFWLNERGSIIFQNLTSSNIGRPLAIVLDGKLKSAPTIQSTISKQGTITGNFTATDAQDLEVVLKSGSLKTRVEVEFENTVGPTLGEDSIRSGVSAMGIGLALVLVFMLLYYRVAGVVTDIVLFINMLLIVAMLSGFNATLTLPGIAGLILTVGMAVDANVLIFERIREERNKGNALARSIQLGYERAFVTIVDANVTTFITALILHQFGTEAVKGFAMTLIIGIICSVFTSLVFTRWCFEAMVEFGWLKSMNMGQFFKRPNIKFSRIRRVAMLLSLICIVIGLFFVVQRGKKNLAQDFTGGLFAQIALTEQMTVAEARDKVKELYKYFPDLSLQSYGQGANGKFGEFILRTSSIKTPDKNAQDSKATKTAEEFRALLVESFPLQNNGLVIGQKRIKDKSDATKAAYAVSLSMLTPRKTEQVLDIIKRNTLVENIEAVSEKGKDLSKAEFVITMPILGTDGKQRDDNDLVTIIGDQFQKLREQKLLDFTEPFPRFSNIGATVASEMIRSAVMALIFSMVAIFVYIWLRFQFRLSFGAGAVIALAHDVLFTLGALAVADEFGLLNGQISLTVVAALLTLVGYSLNDTIVVFDRIRENLRMGSGKAIDEVIDDSVNQTLARTIVTSLTTLLVVVALLWVGGEVIRGFSFALFVGVLVGTYSSIFIASPLLIEFALLGKKKK